MRRYLVKGLITAIAIAIAFGFGANQAGAARVYGTLSNFDIHNFTMGPVNDFHLILQGPGLTCSDIFNYYNGWGTFGGMPTGGCTDLGGGKIRITWGEPNNPLPHCTYAHFGLHLEQGNENVRAVAAYWTFNGQIVGGISFISQTWVGTQECPVGDIVWPPDSIPMPPDPSGPWIIQRSWAWTPIPIELDSLNVNNPQVMNLDWVRMQPETIFQEPLTFYTTPLPQHGALVVQYPVMTMNGDTLAIFTNEAILNPPACCDVNMTPDTSPVVVPAGGSFGLTGTIGNPTPNPIMTDVWVGVIYMSNFYQLWYFANIPLAPGQYLSAHLNQNVPFNAPPGTYTYVAYCGDRPTGVVCDSAKFPFTVTSAREQGGNDSWTLEGGWDSHTDMPAEYSLVGSYPNPFNASAIITYELPQASDVSLEIFNLMGQRVGLLVDGPKEAGRHEVTWNAAGYPSGIYFYRLDAGDKVFTKRMTLLK